MDTIKTLSLKFSLIAVLFMAINTLAEGKSFFASPTGTANGTGSQSNPWSLATALKHPTAVAAGDTIYLMEGTYKGHYASSLKGTSSKPITVMPYLLAKVVIDGNTGVGDETTLTINGAYTNYWNFHVTNTDTKRNATKTAIKICSGIDVFGNNIKLINLMVYDNIGNGIGFWSSAIDSEVYGCIIFHNGYQDSTRGHGHGIYTQNATGTKQIRDNFIFNGFQYGVHAYAESGSITGFNIEGNICFNNGLLQANGTHKSNILVGGLQAADRISIKNNHLLHPFAKTVNTLELGYGPVNGTATITGNVFYGGNPTTKINRWKNITFTGNTVLSNGLFMEVKVEGVDYKIYSWNNNRYFGNTSATFSGHTYANWKALAGFDSQSTYATTMPTKNEVYISPNQYQKDRGHVVVYNWQKLATVQVDLSTVLQTNSTFAIYDIENIKGQPIATGTYTGQKINIPMNTTAITLPNGDVPNKPTHTGVEFGAFVVVGQTSPSQVPTTIEDTTVADQISIYPNPASTSINIDFESETTTTEVPVLVYNMAGKMVKSQQFAYGGIKNTYQLDISNLSNGIYIIRAGNAVQKIVKTNQ
jgi:hypothetical protein